MYSNPGLEEGHSNHHLGSQHVLSRSQSRLQSSVHKIGSHIKSTLPHLQGKADKKYIYFYLHNFFRDSRIAGHSELTELLKEQFEDKIQIRYFVERKQLLKNNYNDNELHYLVVPKSDLEWASTFAKQEREQSSGKVKLFVYGILKKQDYDDKIRIRSKKKIGAVPQYIQYFYYEEQDYPLKIASDIERHLDNRLREENHHIKTWAVTNKYADKRVKKRTLHFFYEQDLQSEFRGIYKTYRKKTKSSWLQLYPFRAFQDILKKIKEREVTQSKELDVARRATSKMMSELSVADPMLSARSMKSGFDMGGSQVNTSVLSSSIRAINKLDKNDVNIIICRGHHPQLEKLKALVRAQKYNNWFLWEISQNSGEVMSKLKDFLSEEAKNVEQLENEEYDRILHSKHLFVMVHLSDDATINMFYGHRNTLNHMSLLTYNDADEFSLFLRDSLSSIENFTIAVVPGGFRSFASQYGRVINEFIQSYRNGDAVENVKFISSAVGKHGSSVFPSSNILSSLTDVRGREYEDLDKIMAERDRLFHPFQGLTGTNVYLLIREDIAEELQALEKYFGESPRLKLSTYMDAPWLQRAIKTHTLKDSVVVVTNDYTLREAQQVVQHFEGVSIMNITDRQNLPEEQKVCAQGSRQHIHNLIRQQIRPENSIIDEEDYIQYTDDVSFVRKNRLLPKDIKFRAGSIVSVWLPADLKDQESRKMQNRLLKHFGGNIRIGYYKDPTSLRILNKSEEPLAFIIWAYDSKASPAVREENMRVLAYLKEMALNEDKELRQEYLIWSDTPDQFRELVEDKKHNRFKFISSRWFRIEEYIIGFLPKVNDSILDDETIFVFYNENDRLSREMLEEVRSRCNQNKLNAANHVTFMPIDDLLPVLDEQSPLFKYYLVINESTSRLTLQDYEQSLQKPYLKDFYVRAIVIREQGRKKVDTNGPFMRASLGSYAQAGIWVCGIEVFQAKYQYLVPHILIDQSNLHYYYFLDKYSQITRKFTFQYVASKEQLRKAVEQAPHDRPIWILVSRPQSMMDYGRTVEKQEAWKRGQVNFIYEGSDHLNQQIKKRVIFAHPQSKEIQKFILNIYRRDKHTFFWSSVTPGNIVLAIMKDEHGRHIHISEPEKHKWKTYLKAKIEHSDSIQQVESTLEQNPLATVYLILQLSQLPQANRLAHPRLKKIVIAPFEEYNFRVLGDDKVVSDNSQLFVGTYPAEISSFLRYLRFNIRKPQEQLEKQVSQEIIELYIQDEYRLSTFEANALTSKNDSFIINHNGYSPRELPELLRNAEKYNYMQVFIGDEATGQGLQENIRNRNSANIRFINMRGSDVNISKGELKYPFSILETNDAKEAMTLLFNLPENRYSKARGHKGDFLIFIDQQASNLQVYQDELQKIQERRNPSKIITHRYHNLQQQLKQVKGPVHVLLHSDNERLKNDVPERKDVLYWIASEHLRPEKTYNSHGNKIFLAKKRVEFQHFMNQLHTSDSSDLHPITPFIDQPIDLLSHIHNFSSEPSPPYANIKFGKPFAPLQRDGEGAQLHPKTLDDCPPGLPNLSLLRADLPPSGLGLDILNKLKPNNDSCFDILKAGTDDPPTRDFAGVGSTRDDFSSVPFGPFELPAPPNPIHNLAILHLNNPEFRQLSEVLKSNLEPKQYNTTLIGFGNEVELEQYSKYNGQRLNGFDKIVVMLPSFYRKHDSSLRGMKGKLGSRMEYFYFDDEFHLENHQRLKHFLPPYHIRKEPLPFEGTPPERLQCCQYVVVMVPPRILPMYQGLQKSGGSRVTVEAYSCEADTHKWLHRENVFLIIVVSDKASYHQYKMHAKISPHCIILVDTSEALPQDELYFFRIQLYSLYFGPNGHLFLAELIRKINPQPHPGFKLLFYSLNQEHLVFDSQYCDYEKIFYKDWKQLFTYLVRVFFGRSNWLLKNGVGGVSVTALHSQVYLEGRDYMRDFKNYFEDRGYLHQDRYDSKSRIIKHEWGHLPERVYHDEKDLGKLLQKQEAPSVVLFDLSKKQSMMPLMKRFDRHVWQGLFNNDERWIDHEGVLLEVEDEMLRRKQDMFALMFNKDVFDSWNDMQYYYLSNKANIDRARNILFRTKEALLSDYHQHPNLLMVVFVEAKDIAHMPQLLMAEADDPKGRVKLILLTTEFVDHPEQLYIKFNEIDPVIKHINDVENAGRIDFMVYHQDEGERTVQTLIQRRRLSKLDDRVYTTIDDIQDIARQIKGKYHMVYVVCFQDQEPSIRQIFQRHSITNKGIPGEGVEFHHITRKSYIRPSSQLQPSHLSDVRLPPTESNLEEHDIEISLKVEGYPNREVIHHREVITISRQQDEEQQQNNDQVPSMDSNIKPNRLDSLLSNNNFTLNIDSNLKQLYPESRSLPRAQFFNLHNSIVAPSNGSAQLFISSKATPQLVALSQDPQKLVIVVGAARQHQGLGNVMVMEEEEVSKLMHRLQGFPEQKWPGKQGSQQQEGHQLRSVEDQLTNIRNLDDFAKVRVVYDKGIDIESKRRLLAASDRNNKIIPIVYENAGQLRSYLRESDSLLLLMMPEVPPGVVDAVQRQNKTIVKRKRVKMIVARKSDSDIQGLQTILEEQEVEQDGQNLNYLSDKQVDFYLKLFQKMVLQNRPKLTKPEEWDGSNERERYEAEGGDMDNITRLNVHSNIDPGNLIQENQIEKIKQRLTGDLIVLVVDNSKRGQVDDAIKRFNVLVQGYTNSMNLENDIRDRKDNVTIAVIDRHLLDKIEPIKRKYPQTAFILQAQNPNDQTIQPYRPLLSGQIRRIADLDKIIADLYQQNERIRFNTESNRAASRFQVKRTSIVDLSNNQKFSVALSNQKSRKAFLFYKEPQNSHIRNKLGQNFLNLNYVPYKSVPDFRRLIDTYNNSSSILIANGNDIPELQEIVSKKKELIYVIRFNPPPQLRDNPKVKKLLSTYKRDDLQKFIREQFMKHSSPLPEEMSFKYKSTKNAEGKKYIQKYEPNTFGTTPRFARDFVPPKSKESTYSRRYMKSSSSRSKISSRLETLSPPVQRSQAYYGN